MTSTFAMDLENLLRAQTMGSSDADMDDTPASSVHESDMEDGEEGSEEEEEDIPLVTLHPRVGHNVDTGFDCPLKKLSKYTLAAAKESARQGCPSCILRTATVAEIISDASDSEEVEGSHDYVFLPFRIQGQHIVLASHEQLQVDEEPLICDFYGDRLGGIDCVERIVPCDTNSPASLKTVKKWLRHCDDSHDCTSPSSPELPRRVLDVRNNSVRLHETSSKDHGSQYACLSHCWGNPPETMLKTTSITLGTHRSAIPWEKMPPTFQHAISFTRKLGLPFLWIDALCIIQCNSKDWQEQSAVMANVYQGAYVTLAATSSFNADGGCYTRSDKPPVHRASQPLAIVHFSDGLQHHLFARIKFTHDIKNLPLLARGWVYQERLLSPRVLHFMEEELVWECNHTVTCECGGDNLEYAMERARISHSNSFSLIGPHANHPEPLNLWYQIVSEYTALSLTHTCDIFPALSGIAKAFAAKTNDDYVAGMWRKSLLSSLLWCVGDTEEVATEHPVVPWRAPSWSWASINWGFSFSVLPTSKELAVIKDVNCTPSGADPTGELATASLTLNAKAMSARANDPPGVIRLANGFIIHKTPHTYSHHVSVLETGHFGLRSIAASDITLVQIATCIGARRVYLLDVHAPIPITQELRSYLLLKRYEDDWIRVGIATIAEYEPHKTLFAAHKRGVRQDALRTTSREEISLRLESQAARNRGIFQSFDDADAQDFVVW